MQGCKDSSPVKKKVQSCLVNHWKFKLFLALDFRLSSEVLLGKHYMLLPWYTCGYFNTRPCSGNGGTTTKRPISSWYSLGKIVCHTCRWKGLLQGGETHRQHVIVEEKCWKGKRLGVRFWLCHVFNPKSPEYLRNLLPESFLSLKWRW